MEAASLIEMCEYLYDNLHTGLATVVTDDDTKMKSQCQWGNEDFLQHIGKPQRVKKWLIVGSKPDSKNPYHQKPVYRKGGVLKYPVPQPRFLADPAHRKKTLKGRLYIIKLKSVSANHGIHDGDIVRLTMYFVYFARTLVSVPEELWLESSKAILDHHFDLHDHFGEWCRRRNESAEE